MRIASICTALAFGLVMSVAAPAAAQDTGRIAVSPVELGVTFTLIETRVPGGGPQFTFNFNNRHALQVSTDVSPNIWQGGWSMRGFYTAQYRYTFIDKPATRVSFSVGAIGGYGITHYDGFQGSSYSYPSETYSYFGEWLYLMAGLGVEQRLSRSIKLRGEFALVLHEEGVSPRITAGIVIPLQRARR